MSIVRLVGMPFAVCLVAAACGAASVSARTSPHPASTPDAGSTRCQLLLQRSVSPCPPADLPLERITIHNGTHGAVPDADVQAQGEAYIRAHGLYVWAVHQRDGDQFLLSGALVPMQTARISIFRGEVKVFADARAAGGQAHIDPLTTTQITLVPVPQSIQTIAQGDGLQPSPYAWVDNQMGPAHAWIDLPDGTSRDEVTIGAGEPEPILVFGQMRSDAELGAIWYMGGEFNCLGGSGVRAVCGL